MQLWERPQVVAIRDASSIFKPTFNKELVHTNVIVDKITTCTRASGPCIYYCHGGVETWDEVLKDPSKYSTYTVQPGATVKFPVNDAANHVPWKRLFWL